MIYFIFDFHFKVWLDQIRCSGYESNIHHCSHLGWGVGDCGHPEDAGVKCHFPFSKQSEQGKVRTGNFAPGM